MEAAQMVRGASISLAIGVAVAVAFGWGAWRTGRRWGTLPMLVLWLVASCALTAIMAERATASMTARGWSEEQRARVPIFWWLLPMWGASLGMVTLTTRRRLAGATSRFTAGMAARSAGAWTLGIVMFFLGFALVDFAGLT